MDAAIHAPEVSAHRTDDHLICEVRTGDHRGLLYQLTRTFSALGWDIHSARINSSSSRTRDVFYVTTPDDLAAEDAARLFVERLESPRADDGS